MMPEMDGIEFAKKVRSTSNIPIILYTGRGSEEVAQRAYMVGIDDYIRKEVNPAHYQVLSKRIRSAVEKMRTEELYETVVENCPIPFAIIKQGKIVYTNNVMIDILDVKTSSELLMKDFINWIKPEDRENITKSYRESLEGQATAKITQIKVRRRDGQTRVIEVSSSLIAYEGEPAHLVFGRDITDLINYQTRIEALHSHATRMANMETLDRIAEYTFDIISDLFGFTNSTIGVVDKDSLRFIYTRNIPHEALPDLPLDGPGVTVRAINTSKTQMVNDTRLDPDYVRDNETLHNLSELDVPVKIGKRVVAVINIEDEKRGAFTDEDKELIEILSEHVAAAISRINKERLIKQNEQRFRAISDNSDNAIVAIDGDMRITYMNKAATKLFGYSQAYVKGRKIAKIALSKKTAKRLKDYINEYSRQQNEQEESRIFDGNAHNKKGEQFDIQYTVIPVIYDGLEQYIVFIRDVTTQKRYLQKLFSLQEGQQRLASSYTIDKFWDIVNTIVGSDPLGTKLEDFKTILNPISIKPIHVDLSELVGACLKEAEIPNTVKLVSDLQTPFMIQVDPYMLREVIINLVKNAVEAMPKGGTLTVNTYKQGGNAVVTITDTGEGIDDAVAENIFKPVISSKENVTRLGLTICKHIVDAHNGSISFKSKKGEGTCFVVTLPFQEEKLLTKLSTQFNPLESVTHTLE